MIYVTEEDMRLFFDNNDCLEQITTADSGMGILFERILSIHREWDIPLVRFFLKC